MEKVIPVGYEELAIETSHAHILGNIVIRFVYALNKVCEGI